MSTAATMQSTPAVPPRPTRSSDNAAASSMPKVPPRPASKRDDRSVSPNPARFAQSPFTEGVISKSSKAAPFYSHDRKSSDPIERSGSVGMPSVGEEGFEYDNLAGAAEQLTKTRSLSPEQTRTIGEDIKLHAPKPSLPAHSAKQRVQAVTRTDSDKAAQYGLGRPRSRPTSIHEDRTERSTSRQGIKKKPSSSFSTHSDGGNGTDEEHGIPQFGHRVPMNPYLGDVQAPSPAPGNDSPGRHHHRKGSSRSLPPGSYGLHGHGVHPQDKLEKAYYQKHPELLEKEQHHQIHERQNDFAMSSSDLNKLVRETAQRGHAETAEYRSTPTDEVAFLASEEYASRISSPRPASAAPKDNSMTSPLKQSFQPDALTPQEEKPIHVDDAKHPEYRSYGDEDTAIDDEEHEYTAPILASDEVRKGSSSYLQRPAVHPVSERRSSSYEGEDPPSRPTSRPTSLYNTISHEYHNSTPLEDVEEYEPLFTEEEVKVKEKEIQQKKAEARHRQHHFPSKDIWEDAPSSVHFTAEVSTPDVPEPKRRKSSAFDAERPHTPAHDFAHQQEQIAEEEAAAHARPEDWNIRDKEKAHRAENRSPLKQRTGSQGRISSPAPAFAQRQEELAEKEANSGVRPEDWSGQGGPSWRDSRPHLATHRTGGSGKFPSRDIWEDTPESAMHVATVSGSPPKPDVPARPAKKLSGSSADRPAVPDRPKPRQGSGDDARPRPPVSDKPKPTVPARPAKSSSGDDVAAKPKPPVPSRPVGGKIAALQAGFMSDLNNRLRIGPQIPVKKEEQEEETAAPAAETEKAPLSDARKSRARGPQRRAPAKSPAPPAEAPKQAIPTFTFTMAESSWSIDPDEGSVSVVNASDEKPTETSIPVEDAEQQTAEPEQIPADIEPQEPEPVIAAPEPAEPESAPGQEASEEPHTKQESIDNPSSAAGAAEGEEPATETKTLVANTAGESVLETEVEKKPSGNEGEPVSVEDTPKDL